MSAAREGAGPGARSERVHRFELGEFQCVAIEDGTYAYTAEQYFANAPAAELAGALERHRLDPRRIPSPYTCLAIDTGRHRVLVDAGGGDLDPGVGRLAAALEAAGLEPTSFDVVIITHAHPDHIGGLCDDHSQPRFPRARHVIAKQEWEYWTSPRVLAAVAPVFSRFVRDHLLPLADAIELVDGESEIVPGVSALPTPGHTPGHIALAVASADEELLYISDAALHPIHLEHPDWHPVWDIDPQQALASRRHVFDRAVDRGSLVLAFHFEPFPSVGHVVSMGGAWEWQAMKPSRSR